MEHHLPGSDVGDGAGLRHIGDFLGHLAAGQILDRYTVHGDLTAGQRMEPGNRAQKGALPTAVGAKQSKHLAGAQGQRDVFHHQFGAVPGADMMKLNHGCGLLSAEEAAK